MVDSPSIKTRSGLTFTADVAGPADGPLVLLLHGFPESRHSWRAALPAPAVSRFGKAVQQQHQRPIGRARNIRGECQARPGDRKSFV